MTGTRTDNDAALNSLRSSFQAEIEKWYFDGALPPSPGVLMGLADCDDSMADMYCELLTLRTGSTYRDAVEKFAPNGTYILDLHGYPVRQAVEIATDTLQAAYQAGFGFVRLIHGAADIRHHMTAHILGRGGIKWALRSSLSSGEWNTFVYPRRSAKHWIGDGSMTLALRTANLNATHGTCQSKRQGGRQ